MALIYKQGGSGAEGARRTPVAAYLPFKTFLSAVEALEHGLPKKLDRSIWRGQAGIVQGQIMMAFRFLSLINERDEPTDELANFVHQREMRSEYVGRLIKMAYLDLFSEHDLTKTTPKMLEEAMSRYGVQGDTRRKAIGFFLRAAKYAELPMHPLLSAQTRNSNAGMRRRRKSLEVAVDLAAATNLHGTNAAGGDGTTKSVTLPSGTVVTLNIVADWLDMKGAERDYIFGLIDSLQQVPSAEDIEQEEVEE